MQNVGKMTLFLQAALLGFFFVLLPAETAAQNTFGGVYSIGQEHEVGYDVIETSEGSILVVGFATELAGTRYRTSITEFSDDGTIGETRYYGSGNDSGAYRVEEIPGQGFVLGGYTYDPMLGTYQFNVIHLDQNFDFVWETAIATGPHSWSEEPDIGMCVTAAGDIIVVGNDYLGLDYNAVMHKLSLEDGSILWSREYDNADAALKLAACKELPDGTIMSIGTANALSNGNNNLLLLQTDANGEELSLQIIGGSNINQIGRDFEILSDGVLVGGKALGDGWEASLTKLNFDGDLLWNKTYPDGDSGFDDFFSVDEMEDGGFVLAGYVGAGPDKQPYLLRTDDEGDLLLNENLSLSNTQILYSVKSATDGGIIVCGYHTIGGDWDLFVRKLDASANLACNTYPVPGNLSPASLELGDAAALSVDVPGGNAGLTFLWQGAISSSEVSPTFEPNEEGVNEVALTLSDELGCSSVNSFEITVSQGAGASLESFDRNMIIFGPNPTTGWVNFKGSLGIGAVELYDLKGRTLPINCNQDWQCLISNKQGNYLLKVYDKSFAPIGTQTIILK